jgi:hypothetical protein
MMLSFKIQPPRGKSRADAGVPETSLAFITSFCPARDWLPRPDCVVRGSIGNQVLSLFAQSGAPQELFYEEKALMKLSGRLLGHNAARRRGIRHDFEV